ncbi:hypothetical protein [Rhizobium sp. 18065]|uniref:hypothetical protein n=1 Tax=Rhizobium sp. 18065 TaxID=2681411 RepID=UPI001357FA9E|nr:hypothetical protein [Rhizobium sp. 18065]
MSRQHLRSAPPSQRRIPRLIFGETQLKTSYDTASNFYRWFRRGDNRFRANGLHGHSGSVFFEAFDEGLKDLPFETYKAAYLRDAAQHTRMRFLGLRAKLKVVSRTQT